MFRDVTGDAVARQGETGGRRSRRAGRTHRPVGGLAPARTRPNTDIRAGEPDRRPRARWRPGYWRRHPAFSLLLVGLVAASFLAWAVFMLNTGNRLRAHGEEATATVVRFSGRTSNMVVRFTTSDGQTVNGVVSRPDPAPRVGDPVTVRYDPADPAGAVRPEDVPGPGSVLLPLGIGMLSGVGGAVYLRRTWGRWRDNAEAWRHHRPHQ